MVRCSTPKSRPKLEAALLAATAGLALTLVPSDGARAQDQSVAAASSTPAPSGRIRRLSVEGNKRYKAGAILKTSGLRVGRGYTRDDLDQALRNLYDTGFFADVALSDSGMGEISLEVRELPVIHRIFYEGTSALKLERINFYSSLRPGDLFSLAAARKQVARLILLYLDLGYFAATVEPKIVQLPNNEVDMVFEIVEGVDSFVRQINFINLKHYSEAEIRGIFITKELTLRHMTSNNSRYNPDNLVKDQEILHKFYRVRGFPNFRVVSAVAELTADRRDFIITYVVDEGSKAH